MKGLLRRVFGMVIIMFMVTDMILPAMNIISNKSEAAIVWTNMMEGKYLEGAGINTNAAKYRDLWKMEILANNEAVQGERIWISPAQSNGFNRIQMYDGTEFRIHRTW